MNGEVALIEVDWQKRMCDELIIIEKNWRWFNERGAGEVIAFIGAFSHSISPKPTEKATCKSSI